MDFEFEIIEVNEDDDLTDRIIVKEEIEDDEFDVNEEEFPESPEQDEENYRFFHENIPQNTPGPTKIFKRRSNETVVEKSWKCDECSKTFSSRSSLKVHRKIHTDSPMACPVCWSSHKNTPSLLQHLYTHRRRGDIDEIPKINPFYTKSKTKKEDRVKKKVKREAEDHVYVKREVKDDKAVVKREIDDKNVVLRKIQEIKNEIKKEVKWEDDEDLKENMEEDSSDSDVDFTNMDLRTFIKGNYKHPLESVRGLAGFSGAPPELKYTCEFCGCKFAHEKTFTEHVKSIHFGIKTPKNVHFCFVCHRQFASKYGLDGHMDTHNKVRTMYSCEYCGHQFMWKCTLAKHTKKHHPFAGE
ncbi:zinc finger and BTB domain-containing protein 41-like [Lutzomyia longipalpis]|uniref:zinc finger and BTB domain-containing protein 41-like n=1 Tax=Lutzomyia longipalpis TaxID=7200 RepID=UPI002483E271|nr:zinc finger and BTB domain-containing protein 41-like [Lutzomyia longipalpis]